MSLSELNIDHDNVPRHRECLYLSGFHLGGGRGGALAPSWYILAPPWVKCCIIVLRSINLSSPPHSKKITVSPPLGTISKWKPVYVCIWLRVAFVFLNVPENTPIQSITRSTRMRSTSLGNSWHKDFNWLALFDRVDIQARATCSHDDQYDAGWQSGGGDTSTRSCFGLRVRCNLARARLHRWQLRCRITLQTKLCSLCATQNCSGSPPKKC